MMTMAPQTSATIEQQDDRFLHPHQQLLLLQLQQQQQQLQLEQLKKKQHQPDVQEEEEEEEERTKDVAEECTIFSCSGLYAPHTRCAKTHVPDFSEVLQSHSINSLIASGIVPTRKTQHAGDAADDEFACQRQQKGQPSEDQPRHDLLGLNAPRGGLLGGGGCYNTAATPTPDHQAYDPWSWSKLSNAVTSTPQAFPRSAPLNSQGGSSTMSSRTAGHSVRSSSLSNSTASWTSLRSTSMSDCSGSNSPSVFDSSVSLFYGGGGNGAGGGGQFPTEFDNSTVSSPDGSLSEIFNTLTLNETVSRYCQHLLNAEAPSWQPYYGKLNSYSSQSSLFDNWNGNGSGGSSNNWNLYNLQCSAPGAPTQLDRAARFHRSGTLIHDATCTWSGVLPPRKYKPISISNKVFLGGVPWDVTEAILIQTFKQFGAIKVEWPGKERQTQQPRGYCYIIFESERNVRALLQACALDDSANDPARSNKPPEQNWYYKISSKRMRAKPVQVIPWATCDSTYSNVPAQQLDGSMTVFVGALYGMLTAEGLATIMNDLFDGVTYAGIDTDKHRYPIGSGRVTFNNPRSYLKAITAAFLEVKTEQFTKKFQVDPYMDESPCSVCTVQQGPYFCKDFACFRYFCRACWMMQHNFEYRHHMPLTRNSKNSHIIGFGHNCATGF